MTEPRGVSGGVVIGIPVTCPEFAAVMLGTWPAIKGGLLITPVGAAEACVMIDDVELDRVGDVGLWTNVAVVRVGGDGAVRELAESRCRWWAPLGKGEGGAKTDVGVGTGVFWLDDTAVPEP